MEDTARFLPFDDTRKLGEDESHTNTLIDDEDKEEVDINPTLSPDLAVIQSPAAQTNRDNGKLLPEKIA